jgi:hypothetical protein
MKRGPPARAALRCSGELDNELNNVLAAAAAGVFSGGVLGNGAGAAVHDPQGADEADSCLDDLDWRRARPCG